MKQIPLYFPPINTLGNRAFRKVCLNSGADFVFSEMVRVEKLIEGVTYQFDKLIIPEEQRNQTHIQIVAEEINNIPEGIDLVMKNNPYVKEINYNMGCPQSTMCKLEGGGGILKNPNKVEMVAKLLKENCDKYGVVSSIKLRLGIDRNSINLSENVARIKKAGINKVYIHGRCLIDTYNAPAIYSEIADVKLKFPDLIVIANGDVVDSESLNKIIKETNCDGVLIGRAAIQDPLIFKKLKEGKYSAKIGGVYFEDRIEGIKEFTKYAEEYKLPIDKFKSNINYMTRNVMRAAEFRTKINNAKSINAVIDTVENKYNEIKSK